MYYGMWLAMRILLTLPGKGAVVIIMNFVSFCLTYIYQAADPFGEAFITYLTPEVISNASAISAQPATTPAPPGIICTVLNLVPPLACQIIGSLEAQLVDPAINPDACTINYPSDLKVTKFLIPSIPSLALLKTRTPYLCSILL